MVLNLTVHNMHKGKSKRFKKSLIIVAAYSVSGGVTSPPGGPEGNDKGKHGGPSGGGRWYYYWVPIKVKENFAKRLVELAQRLNPQVFAQDMPSPTEAMGVQKNWSNQFFGLLQSITARQYVGFGVGTFISYGESRFSSVYSNEKIINQSRPYAIIKI